MAVDGYGSKVFGLRQVKVANYAGSAIATLPAAQELQVTVASKTNELRGNDIIVSQATFIDHVEWKISNGGIPFAALAIMTGKAVTTSGTAPNEVSTWSLAAGDNLPYFRIYGKVLDDATGDLHCKILYCKVTDNIDGTFQDNDFYVAQISGVGLNDPATSKMVDFIQNQTAAALPVT